MKHIDYLSSLCNEQQDERNKFVSVEILSDTLPEPDETIIIYLAQPTGDARIATGTPDGGKKVKKKIIITKKGTREKQTEEKLCITYKE